MIDLKKLEKKFDDLFENETVESFEKWLNSNKKCSRVVLSSGPSFQPSQPHFKDKIIK